MNIVAQPIHKFWSLLTIKCPLWTLLNMWKC